MKLRNIGLACVVGGLSVIGVNVSAQAFSIFFGEEQGGNSAAPSVVNAKTNFLSNLTGIGTENFESFAGGQSAPIALSFPGAGTATLTGGGQIIQDSFGGLFPISGNKYFGVIDENFGINFSQTVAALGFYGTDIGDFGGQITLTLLKAGNEIQTLTVNNTVNGEDGSVLYYGVIADNPSELFDSVVFGNTSSGIDGFGFDDLTVGSLGQVQPPAAVPEPTSMLGTVIACAFGVAMKKNHQSKATKA